jgi:hypothetical protein
MLSAPSSAISSFQRALIVLIASSQEIGANAASPWTAVFSIVSERVISNGRSAAKPVLKAITIQWEKEPFEMTRSETMEKTAVHSLCRQFSHIAVKAVRKNACKKGEAAFAPISWEEAINTISARWKELIAEEGAESRNGYAFLIINTLSHVSDFVANIP